eukprot:8700992-Lingulodinium_polyedra.AAC.1
MNAHEREALPPPLLGSLRSGSATFGGGLIGSLVVTAAHSNPPGGPSSGGKMSKLAIEDAMKLWF